MADGTGTGLTVYDRVEPMDFIEKMGKTFALSGAGGCSTESEGKLMALACLCERKTIFEIARRYHLMGGKLVLKAETMLGDFRRAGGSHRWINDGDDGQACTIELTDPKGNVGTTTMTIGKATAAGYVKAGSQWQKRPDQMLRARCITDGIRKLCPEISSGEFVEEEVEDFSPQTKPVQSRTVSTAAMATAVARLPAPAAQPSREPGDEDSDYIHPVPVGTAATSSEAVPFDVPGEHVAAETPSTNVLLEIEAVITQAGLSIPQLLGSLNAKNKTAYVRLDQLAPESAVKLLENLRAGIAARAAAARGD